MKTIVLTALALTMATGTLKAQSEKPGASDWTEWLVGDWEGTSEGRFGVTPMKQSFRYTEDGQYIRTDLVFGEGEDAFRGFGIFQYFAEKDSAFGNFFDANGVTNDGWAKRFGNKMVWHIDARRRGGRTTTRIRERLSDDEYVVHNYSSAIDGAQHESVERMRRVQSADRSSVEDAVRRFIRSIDYADWDAFSGSLSDDATMFFPFEGERADDKVSIESVMRPIFDRNRARGNGPYFSFEPRNVMIQQPSSDLAVATWVMDQNDRVQRRTAVLQKRAETWLIVSFHGSGL